MSASNLVGCDLFSTQSVWRIWNAGGRTKSVFGETVELWDVGVFTGFGEFDFDCSCIWKDNGGLGSWDWITD